MNLATVNSDIWLKPLPREGWGGVVVAVFVFLRRHVSNTWVQFFLNVVSSFILIDL